MGDPKSENTSGEQPLEAAQNEDAKKIKIIIPSINDSDDEFLEKYDTFINNYKNTINHSNKTENLLDYIKYNLNNLSDRVRIIRLKYSNYKKWYDRNNIAIIIISSFLTLFSAITNQLQTEIAKNIVVQHIIGIIPVMLGATITLIAAIMKFKKLQEKMETISNLIEKSIIVMSKLKKTSEDLYLKQNDYDDKEFQTLESTFLNETCDMCNNCIMQMEQITKDRDYTTYLEKIKESDDLLSKIIWKGKKDNVKEAIYHKRADFQLEKVRKATSLEEYDQVMEKI